MLVSAYVDTCGVAYANEQSILSVDQTCSHLCMRCKLKRYVFTFHMYTIDIK